MIKRIVSALIGFPIVAVVLIFGNKYLVDAVVSIVSIMALYEYFHSFKQEKNPITFIAYISAILIAFIHIIPKEYISKITYAIIPTTILILFIQVVITNMKYNVKDIAIVLFGMCYIVLFLAFIPIIREMQNGKIFIWFVFITAWGTDIFAYFIGRKIGKHKFTKISPNKSIEGCIAGTLGAIVCSLIYTIICNSVFQTNFNYIIIAIMALVLSIIGQIGDLAASSINRYTGEKDFSNLIPGHGGILDRMDSVIFIAPFAYFLLMLV